MRVGLGTASMSPLRTRAPRDCTEQSEHTGNGVRKLQLFGHDEAAKSAGRGTRDREREREKLGMGQGEYQGLHRGWGLGLGAAQSVE